MSDKACTNLYVKNLWRYCNQYELDDLFKPFGFILQSRVYDEGIGFVRYENADDAYKAIQAMHGTNPGNRCKSPLIVRYARNNGRNTDSSECISNNECNNNGVSITNKNNIILRGLPRDFKKRNLRELCCRFGKISNYRLYKKKGKAFVRFENASSAREAMHELNDYIFPNSNQRLFAKLANNDPYNNNNTTKAIQSVSTPSPSPSLPPMPSSVSLQELQMQVTAMIQNINETMKYLPVPSSLSYYSLMSSPSTNSSISSISPALTPITSMTLDSPPSNVPSLSLNTNLSSQSIHFNGKTPTVEAILRMKPKGFHAFPN